MSERVRRRSPKSQVKRPVMKSNRSFDLCVSTYWVEHTHTHPLPQPIHNPAICPGIGYFCFSSLSFYKLMFTMILIHELSVLQVVDAPTWTDKARETGGHNDALALDVKDTLSWLGLGQLMAAWSA